MVRSLEDILNDISLVARISHDDDKNFFLLKVPLEMVVLPSMDQEFQHVIFTLGAKSDKEVLIKQQPRTKSLVVTIPPKINEQFVSFDQYEDETITLNLIGEEKSYIFTKKSTFFCFNMADNFEDLEAELLFSGCFILKLRFKKNQSTNPLNEELTQFVIMHRISPPGEKPRIQMTALNPSEFNWI